MDLGRVGLWTFQLDLQPMAVAQEAMAQLEDLGYGTVWIPEAVGREPFASAAMLLAGAPNIKVATGIASIHARHQHRSVPHVIVVRAVVVSRAAQQREPEGRPAQRCVEPLPMRNHTLQTTRVSLAKGSRESWSACPEYCLCEAAYPTVR